MKLNIKTKGRGDVVDITGEVSRAVKESKTADGAVVIFVPGSTAGITTIEYEDGVVRDLIGVLEKLIPFGADWEHHKKWGDNNGDAHIKSALIGPSLTVPIEKGKLTLGTWQQIVLIDFDEKARDREIVVKVF